MRTKTLLEEQKELEDILFQLGYTATDEYKNETGTVDVLPRHKCRGFHLRIPLAHRGLG